MRPGGIEQALSTKRESKHNEFKETSALTSQADWCEVIKDIVAMANSGGGLIHFGVRNNGEPSGHDVGPILRLDPAMITDQIAKYTGDQFGDFELEEYQRSGNTVALLRVSEAKVPLVFTQQGAYDGGGGKPKAAFSKGTVYFRHGAKSEPGNSNDIREVIEKVAGRVRKELLSNVRKAVYAPVGHTVQVIPSGLAANVGQIGPNVRIVDDPNAPALGVIDTDNRYPHRQKEVKNRVNERLVPNVKINSADIMAIRKVFDIDKNPAYRTSRLYSSPQYSEEFVDWIVEQYQKDNKFFAKTRQAYQDKMRRRQDL